MMIQQGDSRARLPLAAIGRAWVEAELDFAESDAEARLLDEVLADITAREEAFRRMSADRKTWAQ